jgi:hypothetical protein
LTAERKERELPRRQNTANKLDWKEVIGGQEDYLRRLIREFLQQAMQAEMEDVLGAEKGERTYIPADNSAIQRESIDQQARCALPGRCSRLAHRQHRVCHRRNGNPRPSQKAVVAEHAFAYRQSRVTLKARANWGSADAWHKMLRDCRQRRRIG